MTLSAEAVGDVVCELGESPVWLPDTGELAWLDITGERLHRLDVASGEITSIATAAMVTALGLTEGRELIAATRTGFGRLDPDTGAVQPIGDPVVAHEADRMNDGAVAPDGSFWAGSMVEDERAGAGALWRLHGRDAIARQLDGITISNGMDWYPDDPRTMLYVDSATGAIDVLALDADARIASRRRLADVDPSDGEPDGLSIDAEGTAWVAVWGAGEVRGYGRDGRLQEVIAVPARQPSSCVFGGAGLTTLFITSAREDLADPGPDDGRLYRCALPVAGQPPRRYAA